MNIALFDMDGVVVETEHLKAAAHAAAVEHFGGSVPAGLYPRVMGHTHADVRAAFIEAGGVSIDPLEYTRVYKELYFAWISQTPKIVPGALALIAELRERGYRLGLVTSSSMHTAGRVLDMLALRGCFDIFVFGEDVSRGKPDPEPYRLGCQRLGCNGRAVKIAFEDTHAGIISAAEAGLVVFAVRHRFNNGQDFSRARAELGSLEDTPAVLALIEAVDPN